jgi:hypothetical protein
LSVHADLTFGLQSPYDDGSPISQLSLGFNSRFLAFGYQFDRLEDQVGTSGIIHAHTYRIALWGSNPRRRVGVGTAVSLYGGGERRGTGSWDFGVAYRVSSLIDLGAVAANVIGHPTIRGHRLSTLLRPAVTVHAGSSIALQAQGNWSPGRDGWRGYGFGGLLRLGGRTPFQLNARLDTDRSLRRQAFTFGLTVGGENRGAAMFTTSGNLKDGEALSLHGISERSRESSRRR